MRRQYVTGLGYMVFRGGEALRLPLSAAGVSTLIVEHEAVPALLARYGHLRLEEIDRAAATSLVRRIERRVRRW